jgi:hypothetical protein
VEEPAGVCEEDEDDDDEGELPHAVRALATPQSSSSMSSFCSRELRLRRATAAANRPGIQSVAANAIVRRFSNGSKAGADILAVVLVWIVMVTLAVVLVPVNATEDGWKLHAALCGRPVQENVTVPE